MARDVQQLCSLWSRPEDSMWTARVVCDCNDADGDTSGWAQSKLHTDTWYYQGGIIIKVAGTLEISISLGQLKVKRRPSFLEL